MPHTFTLRRLMIGVTILCVIAGVVANFPQQSLALALTLAYFVPATIVTAALSLLSSRRRLVFDAGLLGAVIGFVVAPSILPNWGDYYPSWWQVYKLDFHSIAISAASGALLFGGVSVGFFPCWAKDEFGK